MPRRSIPHLQPEQLAAIGLRSNGRKLALNLTERYGRAARKKCFLDVACRCFDPSGGEWEDIEAPRRGEWLVDMLDRTEDQDFSDYVQSRPNRPTPQQRTLYLQPLCQPGDLAGPAYPAGSWPPLQFLEEAVKAFYAPMRVVTLPAVPMAQLRARSRSERGYGKQYHAGDVLDKLSVPRDAYGVMGITMHDLYPRDEWNFVYGLARLKNRVAVFSFVRHVPDIPDEAGAAQLLHRSTKTLLHELGHMFGLKHCTWYNCLMRGSNGEEVEHQLNYLHLCPVCLRKLHWNIGFDIRERYTRLLALYHQLEESSPFFAADCVFLKQRLAVLEQSEPGATYIADIQWSCPRAGDDGPQQATSVAGQRSVQRLRGAAPQPSTTDAAGAAPCGSQRSSEIRSDVAASSANCTMKSSAMEPPKRPPRRPLSRPGSAGSRTAESESRTLCGAGSLVLSKQPARASVSRVPRSSGRIEAAQEFTNPARIDVRRTGELLNLESVQKRECPKILRELCRDGRKTSCWIWWVCPTEMPGMCDPESSCVTKRNARDLFDSEATEDWRAVLEKLCDLAELGKGMNVVPSIDHGRIHHFLKFWKDIPNMPQWMTSVLTRLDQFSWPAQ